jgi:hypothetical protein
MRDDQDLDIVVDLFRVQLDLFDRVIAAQFLDEHPRTLPLLLLAHAHHHRVHGRAEHRQAGHDAHHGFVGADYGTDGASEVVLEQPFVSRVQEGNGCFVRIEADHETEVEILRAERAGRLSFDSIRLREFFRLRVRLRIDFPHAQFSAGGLTEFLEQVFHLRGVSTNARWNAGLALREVVAHLDGCIELLEDGTGAGRERVELVAGQIDAPLGCAAEQVHRHNHHEHHGHTDRGVEKCIEFFLFHRVKRNGFSRRAGCESPRHCRTTKSRSPTGRTTGPANQSRPVGTRQSAA